MWEEQATHIKIWRNKFSLHFCHDEMEIQKSNTYKSKIFVDFTNSNFLWNSFFIRPQMHELIIISHVYFPSLAHSQLTKSLQILTKAVFDCILLTRYFEMPHRSRECLKDIQSFLLQTIPFKIQDSSLLRCFSPTHLLQRVSSSYLLRCEGWKIVETFLPSVQVARVNRFLSSKRNKKTFVFLVW